MAKFFIEFSNSIEILVAGFAWQVKNTVICVMIAYVKRYAV